jgi:hypothetical protein
MVVPYRLKSAGRLARAAAIPSRTSSNLNPKNSSASDVSKLGPAKRSQLLRACLVNRIAVVLPAANVLATSKARSITSASGTQSPTKPMRSASNPDKGLFVKRWYRAFAKPHNSGHMITA